MSITTAVQSPETEAPGAAAIASMLRALLELGVTQQHDDSRLDALRRSSASATPTPRPRPWPSEPLADLDAGNQRAVGVVAER